MSPKRLFQQFWSFMLPTHTSRNIQQSTGHARRPKWRWLSRFLVFEPQQESIGSILGHTAWASNLFVTQIISRCPHLRRCESHSWTLKLFHLKYLRGPAVFRHSSTKHTLQCVVSGQTSGDCIQSALGFCVWTFGLQLQQLHLPCPCAIPCTNRGGTHGTTHAHTAFFLQWVLTTHHPLQSVKCRVRGPVLTRHRCHLRMLFTRTALAVTMAFENGRKEPHQQPLVEGQRTANFNLSTKFLRYEQFHPYSIFEPSILLLTKITYLLLPKLHP